MTKRIAAQQARVAVASQSRGLYTSYQPLSGTSTPTLSQQQAASNTAAQALLSQQPQQGGPVKLSTSGAAAVTSTGVPVVEKSARRGGATGYPVPPPHGQPQPAPAASSPLDRNALNRLHEVLPEDSPYWRLLDMERQIEERILRKQLAIADASFRVRKVRRLLRIFVSNEAVNRRTAEMAEGDEPYWTLRVQGKLDEPENMPFRSMGGLSSAKFTSLVQRIVVEVDPKSTGAENSDGNVADIFESGRIVGEQASDRFEVVRKGDAPVPVRICIQLDPQPSTFKLAAPLSSLLGLQTASRPQIVVALWQYVKLNRLQESEEKKIIRVDERMRAVFGQHLATITFADIPQLVEPHLLPLDPIVIDYVVGVDRIFHGLDRIIEAELEMEERPLFRAPLFSHTLAASLSPAASNSRQLTGPAYAALYRLQGDIAEAEGQQAQLAEALLQCRQSIHWLRRFASAADSRDAARMHQLLFAQACSDYDALIGQMRITLGELDNPSTYRGPEVEEAIDEYLAFSMNRPLMSAIFGGVSPIVATTLSTGQQQ